MPAYVPRLITDCVLSALMLRWWTRACSFVLFLPFSVWQRARLGTTVARSPAHAPSARLAAPACLHRAPARATAAMPAPGSRAGCLAPVRATCLVPPPSKQPHFSRAHDRPVGVLCNTRARIPVCGQNTYSNAGDTSCTACPSGTSSGFGSSVCACSPGNALNGTTICTRTLPLC